MKVDNTNTEQQAQNKAKSKGQKAWEIFNALLRVIDILCRLVSWLEGDAE